MANLEIEIKTKGIAAAQAELKKMEEVLKSQDTAVKLTGKDLEHYNQVMGKTTEEVKKAAPETEKLAGSKEKLKAALKGLSHEIPGLNYGLALLKNIYLGVALAIVSAAAAAWKYIEASRELVRAEASETEAARQAAVARQAARDIRQQEVEQTQALADSLQAVLDKRKELETVIDRELEARKKNELLKQDELVADGKLTKAQGEINKGIIEERYTDAARAARVEKLKEEVKLSADHAALTKATVLDPAAAAAASAAAGVKPMEERVADPVFKKTLETSRTALDSAVRGQADWDSLSPETRDARMAIESQTGGKSLLEVRRKYSARAEEIEGMKRNHQRLEEEKVKRDTDLAAAQKSESDARARVVEAQKLVKDQLGVGSAAQSALGLEEKGGFAHNLERQNARMTTRLALQGNLSSAKPGTPEYDEAAQGLKQFDASIRPAPGPRGGDRGFIPHAQRRVNRAAAGVVAAEAGLEKVESAGRPDAVNSWKAQAEAAQRDLASATAALEQMAKSTSEHARRQSEISNQSARDIDAVRRSTNFNR